MKNLNFAKKIVSFLLASLIISSSTVSSIAFTLDKSDIDIITNTGVNITVPQVLNITDPAKSISTYNSSYVITGTSNPNKKLYLNSSEITTRGQFGSFAVPLNLTMGQNVIEVQQGDNKKSVIITRSTPPAYYISKTITKPFPTTSQAVKSGKTTTISCVAPAGSQVSASYLGTQVALKQKVAEVTKGVATTFTADVIMPDIGNSLKDCGKITYTLVNNGATTTYNSAGNLFVAGNGADIIVQSNQSAVAVYAGDSTNNYITSTLRYGTVDRVIAQNDTMYQLNMGGWVNKTLMKPLEGNFSFKNVITTSEFRPDTKGEAFALKGSSFPSFDISNTDTEFSVKLYNTTNVPQISTENSNIFSNATVTLGENYTMITFTKLSPKALWGYGIEYNDGETVIYCKKTPTKSSDPNKPLQGITVAIDAGHGGSDPGALGIARSTGPNEKDLTLASALSTKNRLEGLGATVIMARNDDVNPSFNDRMFTAMLNRADFFISIHYNSAVAPTASGTEVYYFEDHSKAFAQNVQNTLVANTGRYDRGIQPMAFRVVLNTYCPSILTEIAFMCNPIEYDSSCTKNNMYNVANALAQGIINSL